MATLGDCEYIENAGIISFVPVFKREICGSLFLYGSLKNITFILTWQDLWHKLSAYNLLHGIKYDNVIVRSSKTFDVLH